MEVPKDPAEGALLSTMVYHIIIIIMGYKCKTTPLDNKTNYTQKYTHKAMTNSRRRWWKFPQEMKVIPPQEKDLMMIMELECQEIEGLVDHLIEIKGIMDPQRMDDIHPDKGHQEEEDPQNHQEEELLAPWPPGHPGPPGNQGAPGLSRPQAHRGPPGSQGPMGPQGHPDKVLGHPI